MNCGEDKNQVGRGMMDKRVSRLLGKAADIGVGTKNLVRVAQSRNPVQRSKCDVSLSRGRLF